MANEEHAKIVYQGVAAWNRWREDHPEIREPNLSGVNLSHQDFSGANFVATHLRDASLRGTKLTRAKLVNAGLVNAWLDRADLAGATIAEANFRDANLYRANLGGVHGRKAEFTEAYLCGAYLSHASLRETHFAGANLREANLSGANLIRACLRDANLAKTNLAGADLYEADLRSARLVDTNLKGAILTGCSVYGVSVWNLQESPAQQSNLVITAPDEPTITVDELAVAQFIHLLLNNQNVRNVIDTVTSKTVLILGRFTQEEKKCLDALREELRRRNYLPVMFDFQKPASRDMTETVATLAHMARFVIAEITDPRSIPQELQAIVPNLPSVPIQPLLLGTEREYDMFDHFRKYPWVLATYHYDSPATLLATLQDRVIAPAERAIRPRG
jgi:uncharacterized protein YjbI with pentapeptide repeats